MLLGKRILIFGLWMTFTFMINAEAQNNYLANPNRVQVQKLVEEIKDLEAKLAPQRDRILQLSTEIITIRRQILPMEEKVRADRQEINRLFGVK